MVRTVHFDTRKGQRGLRQDVLNFILEFGEERFARHGSWLMINKRKLPPEMRDTSIAQRAANWLLLMQGDLLVTCYRSESPARNLGRSY